eukprot:scaffold80933_cov58-Attheya_sp.AAC.2
MGNSIGIPPTHVPQLARISGIHGWRYDGATLYRGLTTAMGWLRHSNFTNNEPVQLASNGPTSDKTPHAG